MNTAPLALSTHTYKKFNSFIIVVNTPTYTYISCEIIICTNTMKQTYNLIAYFYE